MTVSASLVKELRDRTGISMMECRNALVETGGDIEKAAEVLRKKGLAKAASKASRTAAEGLVESYIHHTRKMGVLIEVNCETDFVSRTPDFQELVKELAMQVAAANPLYISRTDISPEVIEKEREIYREQMSGSGKPLAVLEKIVEGKLDKFYQEVCLMEQAYYREEKKKIQEVIHEVVAKLGENIQVRRFQRYHIGEGGR
jgi:elongation factor Ts